MRSFHRGGGNLHADVDHAAKNVEMFLDSCERKGIVRGLF